MYRRGFESDPSIRSGMTLNQPSYDWAVGAYKTGSYRFHDSYVPNYDGGLTSGDPFIVKTGRMTGARFRYPRTRKYMKRRRAYRRRRPSYRKKSYGRKQVSAALSTSRQSGKPQLCKPLGAFFPNCVAVSFRHVLTDRAYDTKLDYYEVGLRSYPLLPGTASAVIAGALSFGNNGGSAVNTSALGFTRLCGTASPQLYKSCLCYRTKYRVYIEPVFALSTSAQGATTYSVPGYTHALFPVNLSDPYLVSPTTAQIVDQNSVQPEVRTQRKSGMSIFNVNTLSNTGDSHLWPRRIQSVKWNFNMWNHKERDVSFQNYLADQNNWGTSSAEPAYACGLSLWGRIDAPSSVSVLPTAYRLRAECTFYCLLKDTITVAYT